MFMRSNLLISSLLALAVLTSAALAAEPDAARYAGFPEIGKHRPGARSRKITTSDAVQGLVRPKWTRAMTDLGGWPAMYRFKDNIHLVFPHVDGHREKRLEATGESWLYTSADHGKTWKKQANQPFKFTPEFVIAGERVFSYDANDAKEPIVRTSADGIQWDEPRACYKAPFYFWGVMYDPESKRFWAPPHAIPSVATHPGRQIQLVSSTDGLAFDFVSQVAPFDNASESVLTFEPDRTMVVLIRRKYGSTTSIAVGKPPYKEWAMSEQPGIVEGHHFFDIGGQKFLASRANYSGDNVELKAQEKLFDNRLSYSVVYKYHNRQLTPWAIMDSMGDCSYPFLVETPTEILCAYYSQHEDEVCKVFLAGYDKREFLKSE